MDMKGGQAESVYRAFGKVPVLATPNMLLPFWFIEGLAVYYETRLTKAGRGQSAIYDMYLRTAALNDEFYTIDEISSQYLMESWPGLQAAYIYGVSLVTYIAHTYGEEVLWELSRAFSETPLVSFGGVLEDRLGVKADQLWRDWQAWLKEKAARQGEEIEGRGLVEGGADHPAGFSRRPARHLPPGANCFLRQRRRWDPWPLAQRGKGAASSQRNGVRHLLEPRRPQACFGQV